MVYIIPMRREKVVDRALKSVLVLSLALLSSCSINQLAVKAVAGFLEGSSESTVFTGDDDPELVGDALPFILKTYESLLEAQPNDPALALATGRAFVSYAYAFVQTPADEMPVSQADEQQAQRMRAKKLYLRAREHVLRGLEVRRPGFRAALDDEGPEAALKLARPEDIDYLYWSGAAWMAAFSADPFDFSLIVTLPRAVALLRQVLAWDEGYGKGAVQTIFISFYGSAPAELGGSNPKARESFNQAVALSRGLLAGPYIALASSVSVKEQNASEFRDLLGKALAIDVDADLPDRLQNIVDQRKAQWMLDNIDEFFISGEDSP
jgi:predicted anti-sigma-YlaC factor YlaD